MKIRSLLVTFLILVTESCNGQKFSAGACPTITPMAITIANPGLLGAWVEYARTFNVGEHGWKCVVYNIAAVTATQESITVTGVHKITGTAKTATGTINNNGVTAAMMVFTGTLSVSFNNNKIIGRNTPVTYSVVGRDVNAAALWITLYGCRNVGLGKLEYVVILTKLRSPAIADVTAAFNAATAAGVPASLIKKTDQTGC
ncbi:uncharacterized protein LOC124174049 [Ischnura elegans]|uniref:uncharacterized protein LOC124174049 n=1 Tax=Ischnura elegans TaxID=197161 RepID=UPI001ED87D06|nr:uncharacterized protein LOC124174049 [Ischnura elegans]